MTNALTSTKTKANFLLRQLELALDPSNNMCRLSDGALPTIEIVAGDIPNIQTISVLIMDDGFSLNSPYDVPRDTLRIIGNVLSSASQELSRD